MASAADSYTKVVGSPINAGGSYRPGGDNIAISFTSGKKSTQEQLDELAIQKAKDDLARLALLPVSSEQQRYDWEAANQKLAEEAAARAATQSQIDVLRGATALKESRALLPLTIASGASALKSSQAALEAQLLATKQATEMGPLDIKAKGLDIQAQGQEISKAKIQTPIQTATMQAGLAATNQAMELAALDAFYKEQEFKDTHWGASPAQRDTQRANIAQNAYNSVVRYMSPPASKSTVVAVPNSSGTGVFKSTSKDPDPSPYWDAYGYNASGKPR